MKYILNFKSIWYYNFILRTLKTQTTSMKNIYKCQNNHKRKIKVKQIYEIKASISRTEFKKKKSLDHKQKYIFCNSHVPLKDLCL